VLRLPFSGSQDVRSHARFGTVRRVAVYGSAIGKKRPHNEDVIRFRDSNQPAAEALLAWGGLTRRDLPWRRTRDPWAIIVAELMLQQTQVDRVVPKYQAFLERFPTPASCSQEALSEVLRLWQGLGYPRRARALHQISRIVTANGSGGLPDTLEGLLALPGVGPYTARAVLAFAYEHPGAAVVDTNIGRVLARWNGRKLSAADVQHLADVLVTGQDTWAWNQSLMELGATVCRSRQPACAACPVAAWCAWHRGGGSDPAMGSAAVSGRQKPFAGSDRQSRGRVLRALHDGPLSATDLRTSVGSDDDARADRIVGSLVEDGLVQQVGDRFALAD
jgi:A/G-specific adenine glycosylase